MKILKITNGIDNFYIENLDLEIKLNLSNKSFEYEDIGDHIYYYFAQNSFSKPRSDVLSLNNEEYLFMLNLNKKSLEDILSTSSL
jgi:hypothetical protein